jgi:hypothetical protein
VSGVERTGRSWRGILADAGLLMFVTALAVKAGYGVPSARDIDISDESYYLMAAAAIPERGLPPTEFAPLYVLWDALLLKLGTPAEDVPGTSWAALAVMLTGSMYLLVRSLGGGRLAALLASGLVPATTLIDVYPYPMHLATVLLMLGTALAARLRKPFAGAALGLSLLTATYARPEFLYAFLMFLPAFAGLALWALWRRPGSRRAVVTSAVVLACGAGLLVWAFGSPKGDGKRSMIAFGQHYAANRHDAGARSEDPWHYWEDYVRADFGEVKTVGEAWQSNREAFLWHLGTNARRTPQMLKAVAAPRVDLLKLRYPQFTLPDTPTRHPTVESLVKWAMLAGLVYGLLGAVIGLRRRLRGDPEVNRPPVALVMLALVAAPAAAASLLVHPRFHYLIPTVAFTTALAAAGYRYLPRPKRLRSRTATGAAILAVAVVLALVVPNRDQGWCIQSRLGKKRHAQTMEPIHPMSRSYVKTIRSLNLPPGTRVMEIGTVRTCYTGFAHGHVYPQSTQAGESFRAFVARENVGVVILEPVLGECPQLKNDPDLRALLAGKEIPGFKLFPLPEYPNLGVAVRRDLLLAE